MRPASRQAALARSVLPLTLLAVLAGGCGPGSEPKAASVGPAAAPAAPATTLLLHTEDLLKVEPGLTTRGPVITGSVQPARRADLRAEVPAVVMQVLRDNGDRVRAGELLMRLDDTALRDNLASAREAERAASEAVEQGERQVRRLSTLKQQGMVSTAALEDAEIRRTAARSDQAAARARVVSARQQLDRTLVRSPFAGLVSERKVSVGDTVMIGRELVKVIDPASMRFEGLVSADRVHQLAVGQKVSFGVNGFPGVDYRGTVQRIDVAANATTRQIALVVAFDPEPTPPAVSGLFAEGHVHAGGERVLSLPERSLVREGESVHVWRVDAGKLSKVGVRLGERDPRSGDWEVREGLLTGQQVLRNPGSGLIDGQAYEMAATAPGAASAAALAAATAGR